MKVSELMMSLISSVVFKNENLVLPESIDDETVNKLYTLSQKHDLTHIVAFALEKNKLLPEGEIGKAFQKQKIVSVFRREQLDFEENRLFALLEENRIDFIPLKGAVIKNFYPESFMRTSCDIDIIVHKEELETAIRLITEKLNYQDGGRHFHEHSLISKSGVHLELHFTVIENIEKLDVLLERIWDFSKVCEGFNHRYELSPEFILFHTVAHMEYHFIAGGCGIRPFIDLTLLEEKLNYSKESFYELINETKSVTFYEGVKELLNVWFFGNSHTDLTKMMEEYILSGGVFGTKENRVSADIHRKGSRTKYLVSRIFMPKSELQTIYPNLKKRPYLLPWYEVKRWFNLLKKKGLSNAKDEFLANKNLDTSKDRTPEMLQQLGL